MINKFLKMIICAKICIIFEPNKVQKVLTRFDYKSTSENDKNYHSFTSHKIQKSIHE